MNGWPADWFPRPDNDSPVQTVAVPITFQHRQSRAQSSSDSDSRSRTMPASSHTPGPDTEPLLVNAYCTCETVIKPRFPHVLHGQRGLDDPELHRHLDDFLGYVQNCGDGTMTKHRYHVMRHIQRTRQQWSFSVETEQIFALANWAVDANAIIFLPDGSVRDPHGHVLISPTEATDPKAQVPFPELSWLRKARTEARLKALGLTVPAHLPPLAAESEIGTRPSQTVAARALAMFVAALHAESIASDSPIPVQEMRERLPLAFEHLSPEETAFLEQRAPSPEDIAKFGWRYEGLFVLLWALHMTNTLPFPEGICDVSQIAASLLELDAKRFLETAHVRPASEILDELDLHYRLHWLIRQSQLDQQESPDGINGEVIYERHYALNWLTGFENAAWDDVDTPT